MSACGPGRAGVYGSDQLSCHAVWHLWARLILDEAYPPVIWGALGLIMLGMYLVQPRAKRRLMVDLQWVRLALESALY